VYGVIISIGTGVVTLQGFLMAFVGEVFRVCSSNLMSTSYGVVVNLYRDDTMNLLIGALLINHEGRLSQGCSVNAMSRLAVVILGDFMIGSIVDPIGNLIFNNTRIDVQYPWLIHSPAPGIISRQSVTEAMQTGILSIDAMIPIGRGQRELIVGDRQTGKTSIGVDTILNQKYGALFSVYIAIGQKASSVLQIFLSMISRDATFYLTVVIAAASSSAVSQFLSAYSGTAMSEFFTTTGELASFQVLDDLSRHAIAYREIYLLLRTPPGREAYPGEVFFVHARLLERSAKLSKDLGSGSLTSFPVIETLAGDVSAYITTNVISITDGQVFLSTDLFIAGIKPSIDVGLSVSRVGSAAHWDSMKLVAGSYKLELAQFVELQSFSQFASDLRDETKKRIDKGLRLVEMLKQPAGSPMALHQQVTILSLANQDMLRTLSEKHVRSYVNSYLAIPTWVQMLVPARLLGSSIVQYVTALQGSSANIN
jgi:F-type H+-transporting ATPase subunit alpha